MNMTEQVTPEGMAVWSDALKHLQNPSLTDDQRAFYSAVVSFYQTVEYGDGSVN